MTIVDSVGFALEDCAALQFLSEAAAEFGIGDTIELVPHTPDPKILFGLLQPASAARHTRPRAEV